MSEFGDKLKELTKQKPLVISGKVVKLNTHTVDVQPSDGSPLLYDVRLQAIVSDKNEGIEFIPALNSEIQCLMMDSNNAILLKYSIIESISIITDKGVVFDEGKNGGVLISQKIYEEIIGIKNDLNTLKTLFKSWIPVAQDGGLALKNILINWFGKSLKNPQKTDLENPKLKH